MWILKTAKGELYHLTTGKDHVVSRRDGDLTLADDQSISRRHATISVEHDVKNLADPSKLPIVTIREMGSKYGTFINEGIENGTRIAKDNTEVLKNGDRIRFGLQWNEWRLEYVPLVVTTSTLTNEEKKKMKQHILTLGGHIVNNWQDTVTHVTMSSLTLTVKVVCALANGKPIITPLYWEKYIEALSTKDKCPDSKDYIPPLAETTLNVNEVSFDINENRKTLFAGKEFVFSSAQQYSAYSCMVTSAGAKASILDQNGMTHEELVKQHIIVVQHSLIRPSQDSQMPQTFQEVLRYLKSKGKRVIPESDIGLAILHCSIDKHCNPDYKIASTLLAKASNDISEPGIILAMDTEEMESQSLTKIKQVKQNIIIPESGTVKKPNSSTIVVNMESSIDNTAGCSENNNAVITRVKKERLSTDEVDACFNPRKRFKSLKDDGFTTKKSISSVPTSASQIVIETVKSESLVKSEINDEDLFNFDCGDEVKPKVPKISNEDDEDMFAFDVQEIPKSSEVCVEVHQPSAPLRVSKKRKSAGSNYPELNSCKRPALELDAIQEDKVGPVSLDGFLSTDQEKKGTSSENESVNDLTENFKDVTVIEVKALISRSTKIVDDDVMCNGEPGINFKTFKKVQKLNNRTVIKSEDLIANEDSEGYSKWLNETRCEDEEENEEDWACFGSSITNKKTSTSIIQDVTII